MYAALDSLNKNIISSCLKTMRQAWSVLRYPPSSTMELLLAEIFGNMGAWGMVSMVTRRLNSMFGIGGTVSPQKRNQPILQCRDSGYTCNYNSIIQAQIKHSKIQKQYEKTVICPATIQYKKTLLWQDTKQYKNTLYHYGSLIEGYPKPRKRNHVFSVLLPWYSLK